jgi:hypothetical protein
MALPFLTVLAPSKRSAHGTRTINMVESQRRPLALTNSPGSGWSRVGGTGGEENFLDPDPHPIDPSALIDEEVQATRDGELFLFVNDAVIGIPGLYDVFYRSNQGSTKVLIEGR